MIIFMITVACLTVLYLTTMAVLEKDMNKNVCENCGTVFEHECPNCVKVKVRK